MSKTVLITGSTSGIGLSAAKAFAEKGYNIIFNGLEENGAAIAAAIAAEYGVQYLFSPANLLRPGEIRDMVAQALQKFGSIEVAVNNAGIQYVSPIEGFPEEEWDAIIGIILTGAFHVTKAIWPTMKKNKFGRIINISSVHGLVASPFKSAYVAAKHGLIGLTKTLALEGADFGITVNAICPGYVLTALVEKQIPEQMKAHNLNRDEVIRNIMLAGHAIKEFIDVETVAQTIIFLGDSPAASAITGVALPIDGGWSAH